MDAARRISNRLRDRRVAVATAAMLLVLSIAPAVASCGVQQANRTLPSGQGGVTFTAASTQTAAARATTGAQTASGAGDPRQPGAPGAGTPGGASSGDPTSAPGGSGASATPSGTTPAGADAPTATPAPPTPTTPPAIYDAVAVGPTSAVTVAPGSQLYLDVRNTGNTTWSETNGNFYYAACLSGCPSNTYSYGLRADVAPGDTYRFTIEWGGLLTYPRPTTYHTRWRVYHGWYPMQEAYFGADMQLDVTEASEQVLLSQSAPACGSTPDISWTPYNIGSGNTATCASSGLVMQLGSGQPSTDAAPRMDITSDLPAYTSGTFHLFVHVHFNAPSSTTYAGFAMHTNWPHGCAGRRLEVRSDGAFRVVDYYGSPGACSFLVLTQGTLPASNDYDLYFMESSPYGPGTAVYYPGGEDYMYIDDKWIWSYGTSWLGPDGLIVEDATGNSTPVTFSNLYIGQSGAGTCQFQLV